MEGTKDGSQYTKTSSKIPFKGDQHKGLQIQHAVGYSDTSDHP